MGRQAWRIDKSFEGPMNQTWWGYLLDPIPCQSCKSSGKNSKDEYCPACEGEGKVWPKVEPPGYPVDRLPSWLVSGIFSERFGWQMWENTSEGSPISPIFDTPEELARWLANSSASACGDMTASYESWLATITGNTGSAVSMVIQGGKIVDGVTANRELKSK